MSQRAWRRAVDRERCVLPRRSEDRDRESCDAGRMGSTWILVSAEHESGTKYEPKVVEVVAERALKEAVKALCDRGSTDLLGCVEKVLESSIRPSVLAEERVWRGGKGSGIWNAPLKVRRRGTVALVVLAVGGQHKEAPEGRRTNVLSQAGSNNASGSRSKSPSILALSA